MSLLEQMRLLDRALRLPDLRAELDADRARLAAVGERQAEMIRDRWWRPRFPATIQGAARALAIEPFAVVRGALASEHYDARVGADDTGAVLLRWLLDRRKKLPPWLVELAAYEYAIGVAIPRRARGLAVDAELESRLMPEATSWIAPSARRQKRGELRVAAWTAVVPFTFAATELRPVLGLGKKPTRALLEPSPHVLAFVAEKDGGALEIELPPLGGDVLSLAAEPIAERALIAGFDRDDRDAVKEAIGGLLDLGALERGGARAK